MTSQTALLRFDIKGWWTAGSGTGVRGYVAGTVQRSGDGLPMLTGKAVKGLVREAMTQAEGFGRLEAGICTWLCGSPGERVGDMRRARFHSRPGRARFGNAELPEAWRAWAAAHRGEPILDRFFDVLHQTAVDDDGLAAGKTLRSIEVAAPMVLHAPIELAEPAPFDWRAALAL
ncbi:MAG TPA: hypothetical protein VK196_15600, partial [Magnetospirillum sp.]|nr:hypothetical protein [Magnetospirillum sp.]